jgi:hypothetical protein
VLGTHGRGVIILDDIAPLEWLERNPTAPDVQLFPLREATEVFRWRDQPPSGGRTFTAPNIPIGALITYALRDPDTALTVRLRVLAPNGTVVRELSGPGTPGMHRVPWDLRMQFALVPPAADSGFYGPPRPPYVLPGDYTIQLFARGRAVSQTVHVRTDPRALGSPEALHARWSMMMEIDSLSRVFLERRTTFVGVDSEYTRLVARLGAARSASEDNIVKRVDAELAVIRPRYGLSYETPIGQAFDLLGGLESSSMTPTVSERLTLNAVEVELRDAEEKLRALIPGDLERLRAAVGLHDSR